MTKIAIIGAGSIVFCKTLILDILASGLSDLEFSLMAPTERKTMYVKRFVERVMKENGFSAKVHMTTDRREASRDAKYVISTFQIGGLEATELDYEIPMKYGVDQCIGDTLSPGGIFRALRSIPVSIDLKVTGLITIISSSDASSSSSTLVSVQLILSSTIAVSGFGISPLTSSRR